MNARRCLVVLVTLLAAGMVVWLMRRVHQPAPTQASGPVDVPAAADTTPLRPETTPAAAGSLSAPDRTPLAAASAWEPPLDGAAAREFVQWSRRYLAAPVDQRPAMLEEGVRLAKGRLSYLREMIESEPRSVLGSVVPYAVRRALPAELHPWLEERVNTTGPLNVTISCGALVGGHLMPGILRSVSLRGVPHEAFTFGAATAWWSQETIEVNGAVLPAMDGGRPRLVFSPYPARLLEVEEARAAAAENVAPAGDGLVVVERGGKVATFPSLAEAERVVGGLPAEGWDVLAYGGPDSGPLDTSVSLPTGGSATGTAAANVARRLNSRHLLIRQSYTDAPAVVSDAAMISAYTKYADAVAEGSYGQRTCAPLSLTLNATDSWLLTITMPATRAAYAAGTADVSVDTYNTVRPLLQAQGQDYDDFDHFVMCDRSGLIGGGLGSYGPWFPGYAGFPAGTVMGWSWNGMNEDAEWNAFLLMHEVGHNLYLPHAHRWLTNSRSLIGPGSTEEYGDGEDAMGGGDKYRSFAANHRLWLGWIPASDAPVITTSGTYRVQTFDENSGPAPRMLRVRSPLKPNVGYFVQRHTGINGAAESGTHQRTVSIRWGALNGNRGWRIDTSQGRLGNSRVFHGHTFSDRRANVHITPLADVIEANGKRAVDVYVAVNPPASNQPPVISSYTVTNATPAAGANVTFTVAATDPDGDALSYAFDSGVGEPTRTNATTLTRSFTAGEWPVQVRVSDRKGGVAYQTIVVRAGAPTTFSIGGTVYVGGDPAVGMLVSAGSAYAFTDSDGTYRLTNLAAGTYSVSVRDPVADDYTFTSSSRTISTASLTNVDFYGDSEGDSVVGMTGTYFSGTNFNTLRLTRRESEVDFAWGDGSPASNVPVDGFSARWSGRLLTTRSGGYQFHVLSDEGARLFVDNVLVLDRWNATTLGEQTVWVPLAAGRYVDVRVEYRHASGDDAQVRFSWTPPGGTQSVVPDGALTPKTNFWVSEWYNDTNLGVANYRGSRMELASPDYDFGATPPDFPGIGGTNFSVRWLGRIVAPTTGTYTFHTDADDGTRVWVNGTQLINDWTVHGVLERTGTIALTAGQEVDVVLEYFQGTGGAAVKLSWTPPGGTKAVIPISAVRAPLRRDHLYTEFFSNRDLAGDPVATRWDHNVDFNFGTAAPDPRLPPDTFSVRWSGRILTTTAGSYTFETASDDGVRLYVNGALVINDWTSRPLATRTGTITLPAATWHDIRLEYFDNVGGAEVRLRWRPPGAGSTVAIPAANLALAGGNTPPFLSPVPDSAADVGLPTAPIPVSIGDPESAASTLTFTAASSNPAVLPDANIVLAGTDGARTVTLTPIADGTTTVTLTVGDGTTTSTGQFLVTAAQNGGPALWTSTTTGAARPWSGAANWQANAAPSAGNAASVDFLSGATLTAGTVAANNDLAAPFTLNTLTLAGTGPASAAANVTLSGGGLSLVTRASSGAAPVVNLTATRGAGASALVYNVANPVTLGSNTSFTGSGNADFVISGAITGGANLTKAGTSSLLLTGTNSYTGTTTISGGAIFVGRNTATGSVGTGPVINNGTLRFFRNDTGHFFGNTISGTGSLQMGITTGGVPAAVTTLTAANAFSGNVTINSGGLRITRADALGTGAKSIALTNGSAGRCRLILDGSGGDIALPANWSLTTSNNDATLPAIISEAGNNTIAGNLTLVAGGGGTRVRVIAGSLVLSGNATAGTTNRTLELDGAGTGTFSGALLDNGTNVPALIKHGGGTWTLTSTAHTYTGSTTVELGTLAVSGALMTTSTVSVGAVASLAGIGTIGAPATVHGTHAPGPGVGTLTHGGSLRYGGASRLQWELGSNAATGGAADRVAAAAVTIDPGAALDLVFNGLGSTVNFSAAFWQSAWSWPVLTSTALTGTFTLGTRSTDPGGRSPDAYGQFSLSQGSSGVTLNWTPFTPWESWQYSSFGANWSNPAIAGDSVDTDADGLRNLAEYGMGTSGSVATPPPAPALLSNRLSVIFTRNTAATDVTITVQAADAVGGPWTDLARSVNGGAVTVLFPGTSVTEAPSGTVRVVEVRDPFLRSDPTRPRRFLRLHFSR